ncbi:MAG TPA: NADP-dependent oxidoreductase [Opitutus sp.]|nr:NADP-dependent oxidoreductase [Opitutus sp.]
MKAIIINGYGDPEELREAELPVPQPSTGEVLVEIHAASINPVDWKIRSGRMSAILSYSFPLVLGLDISGVVKSPGASAHRFKIGDEVLAKINLAQSGGYAEFTAIDENRLLRKPTGLSFAEAAALPLAGITAWTALTDHARLSRGETILIHGGAGGVGSLAIQFAKALGAVVVTTASEANTAFVRSLGADRVINYRKEDFASVLGRTVDVVFDMIGGDVLTKSYDVLVPGGRLVTISSAPDASLAAKRGITASFFVTPEGGAHLAQIVKLVEEGRVRPIVSATVPLTAEGIQQAHRQSEAGHVRGKIVIQIK